MLLLCIKIFCARILDVSLGTIRTVLFVKGKTFEPFVIAFFEVIVWFVIAREALNADGNMVLIAISYAGGYATGTYIGSKLSNLLIKGVVGVQVVIDNNEELINDLKNNGYGLSVIELKRDSELEKDMLYIQIKNKELKNLMNLIKKYDKDAFIAVNDTKLIQNGIFK